MESSPACGETSPLTLSRGDLRSGREVLWVWPASGAQVHASRCWSWLSGLLGHHWAERTGTQPLSQPSHTVRSHLVPELASWRRVFRSPLLRVYSGLLRGKQRILCELLVWAATRTCRPIRCCSSNSTCTLPSCSRQFWNLNPTSPILTISPLSGRRC